MLVRARWCARRIAGSEPRAVAPIGAGTTFGGVRPPFPDRPCHCRSGEQTGGRRSRGGRIEKRRKERERGWPRCLFRLLKKTQTSEREERSRWWQDDEMAIMATVAVLKIRGVAGRAEDRAAVVAGQGRDDDCGGGRGEVEGAEDGAELAETDSEEEPHPEGVMEWEEEFKSLCGLTIHHDNAFHS